MLEAGIKGRQEVMVTDENSAAAVGSGLLPVFATPAMVALMEKTAWYKYFSTQFKKNTGMTLDNYKKSL